MRRFRPRSSKPGRLWPWMIIWALLVIAYLMWVGWPRDHTQAATLNQAVTRSVADITVTYSGLTWQNKPVYVLHNLGPDLEHVNIYNWSEDQLPVLYTGVSAPSNLTTRSTQANPPYSVPKGARMWFVSSMTPPTIFTVTWDERGNVRYTTVRVTDTKKPSVPSA